MRMPPWPGHINAWPIILLMICLGSLAAGLYPALSSHASFAPSHDTTWLTSPMLCEFGRHYALGRIPLLDWTTFEPVSHNLHLSALYPFTFAWAFDYCDLHSAIAAHDSIIALHLFLMFGNAVVLGRAAGLSWTGALMAGFAITASSNAMALARWPSLVAAAAWMPLAAAGLLLVLHRGRWLAGSALVVVGTSLMLMANPATNLSASLTFFGLVVGGGAVLGAVAAGAWRGRLLPWVLCGLCCVALIALLSLGTSGNALLALDDLVRWNRSGHVIGRAVSPDFAREVLAERQAPRALLGMLLPLHPALVAGSFFLGGIVAGLAALGAWDGRREGLTRTLLAILGLVVLFVFLDPGEWVLLWGQVPGLSHTRHLSLLGSPFMMAAGLLAGRGLEVVLRPGARRARRALGLALAALALCSFPASLLLAMDGQHRPRLLIPMILACALLAAVLLRAGDRLAAARPHLLAAAVLLCAGILAAPQLSSRMLPMSRSPAITQAWQDLTRLTQRILAADPVPGVLLYHGDISADGLNYSSAGTAARLAGAPTFQYFNSPRVFWQFFAVNYRFPDHAFYARHGARYLLAENPVVDAGLEEVGREGAFLAYRLRDPRPMVVPLCGLAALDPGAAGGPPPRPSQRPSPPPALRDADASLPACQGTPVTDIRLDRAAGALRFALGPAPASPGSAQALVLNLPPHAGWRLTMEGQPVPLFTLDDMRMVAPLAAGHAGAAMLAYRPRGVILRQAATAGGWALLLAGLAGWGVAAWRRHGLPATPGCGTPPPPPLENR